MLKLYPARSVITMNPSLPRANAILVRDQRIVEVGDVTTMQPWLDRYDHEVDDRFAEHIICPGLIDPHLHPSMAAVLLPMEFITAMRWRLPWGTVEPTLSEQAFNARLAQLHQDKPADTPLFVWGYHPLWHGAMDRGRINQVSAERPIVVWHRSFHELFMNDAALTMTEITQERIRHGSQIDFDRGHFFENGLGFAIDRLNPWILSPQNFSAGLERLKQVVHKGGHTSIGDLATGLFDFETEMTALANVIDGEDVPFRTRLVPHGGGLLAGGRSPDQAVEYAKKLMARNTHKLQFGKHIKLFADGAFFSQLAQVDEPGYIDGHEGEWLVPPETLEGHIRAFWHAGFQIHVHICGDLALELTLDILEQMQFERPRFNHGFTIEHFGFSTPEQIKRIATLGAQVSANAYYLHELSDVYAREGIGYERASQMSRLGACFNAGINTTVHSDFTMAPAEPLNSAWVAVNRVNHAGDVMGAAEKLTQQQALEAITINAAHVLGMANDTGSLRAGKYADLAVLDEDPLTCDPMALNEINVLSTMFEGRVFEL